MRDINLYNNDCLKVLDLLISLNIKVDAIITDPPFGTTKCKWDVIIPFDEMWKRLNKIIKPNGAIVLFGNEPFSSALRVSNIKNYKYDWKWDKKLGGNPLNAKKQPLKTYEDIMVFNKHNYYPIMTIGKMRKKGGVKKQPEHTNKVNLDYSSVNNLYYPKSILEFPNVDRKSSIHPTQKPIGLLEYLIKTYTLENEIVLDFTMGSFSTGIACVNTNRRFIGIESDEDIFNRGLDRFNNHLNQANKNHLSIEIVKGDLN